MSSVTMSEWLSAGPFSLAMSSGFFSFFAHTGMLVALEENGLSPHSVSGSSAGALVAGLFGAGMSGKEIQKELFALKRKDFWDPKPGFGLLGGQLFREVLERLLPVQTFEECPVRLCVSVYDLGQRRTKVLQSGSLASAIHASCAMPVLFHPVRRDGCFLSDGGIADRPGLEGIGAKKRVFYHHIVSRSSWRRPFPKSMVIPKRAGMISLCIENLARVSPFHMERGLVAFHQAKEATHKALLLTPVDSIVSVG